MNWRTKTLIMTRWLNRIHSLLILSLTLFAIPTASIAQLTEASATGVLSIVWGNPQHPTLSQTSSMRYTLALPDGTRLPLQMNGQENIATFYFGKQVTVSGHQPANQANAAATTSPSVQTAFLVESIAPVFSSSTLGQPQQSQALAAGVSGTKKVIYLLLKFSDDTAVPHPPAFYTDLNNPDVPPAGALSPATVNGFFKKVSGGLFSWVGDVGGLGGIGAPGGWLTLPHPKSYYANCGWTDWTGSCADIYAIGDDGTALGRAQGIDFKNYDNINFVLSNDLDCCAYGGFFYSSVDAKGFGATWEPPPYQEATMYAHEMGHSLGLPHSGWVYSAYDSPWDMMSARLSPGALVCGTYTSRNSSAPATLYCSIPGNEYIAAYKNYLGWLPTPNVIETSTSLNVSVNLEATALPISSATKMMKICITGSICTGPTAHYFTAEARAKGVQFDNGLLGEGVIIHEFQGDRPTVSGPCFRNSQSGWAWPIDATPGDYDSVNCNEGGRAFPNYALYNAQWNPGQTYTNSVYGFSVSVISRNGSTFAVTANSTPAPKYTLAVSTTGSGQVTSVPAGINCGTSCTAVYASPTVITLNAAATSGSTFISWSGAGCSGTGTCTVSMSQAQSVTATFALPTYTVTGVASPVGGGSVSCTSPVTSGSTSTCAITTNSGYTRTAVSSNNCGGGLSGNTYTTGPVTSACTVTTYYVPASTLSVGKTGTGSGNVSSNPAGISCGATCSASYASGTSVTLSAASAAGSTFTGWSGACTGTGTCTVSMSQAQSVTASFSLINYSLSVAKSGTGSGTVASTPSGISCGATCSANYAYGTSVTLSAIAANGSTFTGWSGACTGTGTCTVSMSQAQSVTVSFSLINYSLSVAKSGTGSGTVASTPSGISCGATCSANYAYGTSVTLSAIAANGSTFTGWSGACTGTGTGTCTVSMSQAQSVTANFALPPRLINLSTRGPVQTGDNVMIGGFVIGGSTPKKVLIRVVGPNLANYGVTGVLADPTLQLFSGQTPIASNNDWSSASNAAEIQAANLAPANSLESAILATLNPGAYTAIVSGISNGTGVAIIEVYDLDHPEAPLINISTRGKVQTGDGVMIGGFIIQGSGPQTVLIRAGGPTLANYGVTGALADPMLELHRSSDGAVIDSNNNWGDAANAAAIQATGLAPVSSLESAILITLQPGAYTAIVSGANGGTGVGIIEVFAQ